METRGVIFAIQHRATPFVVGTTDPDGDTHADDHDNCPCSFNPLQEDYDGDGYGDNCDVCDFHLVELPIYGMGRVGVAMPDININTDLPLDTTFTRHIDQKFYELTNHPPKSYVLPIDCWSVSLRIAYISAI